MADFNGADSDKNRRPGAEDALQEALDHLERATAAARAGVGIEAEVEAVRAALDEAVATLKTHAATLEQIRSIDNADLDALHRRHGW